MTMGRIWLFAATLLASVGLIGASSFAEEPVFSDTQKEAMHKIIRDYLISNPDVIREAIQALQLKEHLAEQEEARKRVSENADALYRSKHGTVVGNPDGNVTLVEFFDYNCGYCKRSLPDVVNLVKEDGNLKLILVEFPILGPGSVVAARAALASKKQDKYWQFHVAMMANRGGANEAQVIKVAKEVGLDVEKLKTDMAGPEVDAAIKANMSLADAIGVTGTPAFIIDDNLFPGAIGIDSLREQVASVREKGGCSVC